MRKSMHSYNVDQGQSTAIWSCRETALALLQIAKGGSEESVELRPVDVGLSTALVQRFDEASRGDIESLPQRSLDACGGDFLLDATLWLLTTLSVARPGSPGVAFMMDWLRFSKLALALLWRTPDAPTGLAAEPPPDGDWRQWTLDMREGASVAKRAFAWERVSTEMPEDKGLSIRL